MESTDTSNQATVGTQDNRQSGLQGAEKRDLFAKIEGICRRYSIDLQKAPIEQLEELLAQDCEELKNLDPLSSLKATEKKESIIGRELVAYRFTFPSIKALNDNYLGENDTNTFMRELHGKVHTLEGLGTPIKTQFKGGFILAKAEYQENDYNLYKRLEKEATAILIEHLRKRLTYLQTLEQEPQIETNTANIQALLTKLETGELTAELTFGVADPIEEGMDDNAMSELLLNAERGANIAKLRREYIPKEAKEIERSNIHRFNKKHLYGDLKRATENIRKIALNEDETEIKDEWKFFFEFGSDGKLYMTEEAITLKRKPEKLKEKPQHKDRDFLERLETFSFYYATINTIDVLKNYRTENINQYFERTTEIATLIRETENILATPNGEGDRERLISLLARASKQLELSIKDEGQKICKTYRALIKAVLEGKPDKILVFGDIIGFGVTNMRGLEKAAHKIAANEEAYEPIKLAIGDEGTQIIRLSEEELYETLDGEEELVILNSEGGDEIRGLVLNTSNKTPETHSQNTLMVTPRFDLTEVAEKITTLSDRIHMRIVVFLNKATLPSITIEEITEEQRAQISRFIKINMDAESIDTSIKTTLNEEPRGPKTVVKRV